MGGGRLIDGPSAVPPGVDLATVAAGFGHLLHAAGVPVTPERSGRFAQAVVVAVPATVDDLYWLGRVTLLSSHEHLAVYDAVFGQVFRGLVDVVAQRGPRPPPANVVPRGEQRAGGAGAEVDGGPRGVGAAGTPGEIAGEADAVLAAASRDERLGTKDFARCTPEELAQLHALVARLPVAAPLRPSRRSVRHPRGRRVDVRATLRRARRTGGDAADVVLRRPKQRPRRLVLIADVSGSMEPYARTYLHLLHGAVRSTRAEAFVFATRLTRLTRALAVAEPDVALARAAKAAPDWSGGTRIGEALRAFLDGHGRRGVARGAVVVIVSDGWERDDPAVLGEQMARLARLAHRIVWVNPRKAAPGYAPLAGGMAAALPHTDVFVSGHSLRALDEVVAAIAQTAHASKRPASAAATLGRIHSQ